MTVRRFGMTGRRNRNDRGRVRDDGGRGRDGEEGRDGELRRPPRVRGASRFGWWKPYGCFGALAASATGAGARLGHLGRVQ